MTKHKCITLITANKTENHKLNCCAIGKTGNYMLLELNETERDAILIAMQEKNVMLLESLESQLQTDKFNIETYSKMQYCQYVTQEIINKLEECP